ncbi:MULTISPECIES: hypothetical protein [unclassified Burkholderia]|nr:MULTISPECIES: hypothetical protein [unclassified Burkholderia]
MQFDLFTDPGTSAPANVACGIRFRRAVPPDRLQAELATEQPTNLAEA